MRPVSPVKPLAGAAGKAGELPFEAQGFDSLLAAAREGGPPQDLAVGQTDETNSPRPPGPLDALADFGRIDNPSLRELLAQQRSPAVSNATAEQHQPQPPQQPSQPQPAAA